MDVQSEIYLAVAYSINLLTQVTYSILKFLLVYEFIFIVLFVNL